ncbi:homoserine dehydrogenase [uncultured Mailhella sp.]|uniref:homoserine dehydrogenase n=1 Tax=uncultured Mailhella sp. TaxID=1981031 RepID=UPI00262D56E0|nr:homoserine dehydrogenase [uncultured Mailhella sp.]
MPQKLCIGVAGLGTVGSGLVEMLIKNHDDILRRTGREIVIKTAAVHDLSKKRELPAGVALTSDVMSLADDPDIQIVVELMGGTKAARHLVMRAIENGKSVVTANKALLAEHGREIFALAQKKNVAIGYEASVAGAIPIIQTLKNSLAGNHITSVMGILNGTSNYILSEMNQHGFDFPTALREAQELGLAEADPSLDIDGQDAAHKLTLLIRLAWGRNYPFSRLAVEGIRGLNPLDIKFAREFGCRIKLIGQAREVDGKIEAGVFPALMHHTLLLARVNGAYNAVRVEGNAVGSLFLHGLGAGRRPTASAVLGDLLALARRSAENGSGDNTGFVDPLPDAEILPSEEAVSPWYVRATVRDTPGVLRDIAAVFTEEDISFAQILQKAKENDRVPLIFMTHETTGRAIHTAVRRLEQSGTLLVPATCFRILGSCGDEAEEI